MWHAGAADRIFRKNCSGTIVTVKSIPLCAWTDATAVGISGGAKQRIKPSHKAVLLMVWKASDTDFKDNIGFVIADIIQPLHRTMDVSNYRGARMARSSTPISRSPLPPPFPPFRTSAARQGDSSSPMLSDGVEPVRLVSQDRSPTPRAPLMPLMDLDIAEFIDAPPRFFLATPAEVFEAKGVSEFGRNQRERLLQFQSIGQGPSKMTDIDQHSAGCFEEYHCRGIVPVAHGSNAGLNLDDMIDEEVALASARATMIGGSSLVTKFKLRPKPRREEDFWDPDFVFRD